MLLEKDEKVKNMGKPYNFLYNFSLIYENMWDYPGFIHLCQVPTKIENPISTQKHFYLHSNYFLIHHLKLQVVSNGHHSIKFTQLYLQYLHIYLLRLQIRNNDIVHIFLLGVSTRIRSVTLPFYISVLNEIKTFNTNNKSKYC